MSTRGIIARVGQDEGTFTGVYHHWDSSPTSLGGYLYELLHGYFKNDLGKLLHVLIDDHNGWSTIVGSDFRLKPGYEEKQDSKRPRCYCHGHRSEQNPAFTEKDLAHGTDIEWVYAFDEEKHRVYVRDVSHDAEIIVELNDPAPNWEVVACGDNWERCIHFAWAHKLLPHTSNLTTQAWLGNRPLEFNDAIAFVIGGKRYSATGCGGNSDYYNRTTGTRYPSKTWIEAVAAKNGKRLQFPVAAIEGHEYRPLPGVAWVYPPTKNNPAETVVEG